MPTLAKLHSNHKIMVHENLTKSSHENIINIIGSSVILLLIMVLQGNLEPVAHAGRKKCLFGVGKNLICDYSRSNQMP